MSTEAYRIEKLRSRTIARAQNIELAKALIANPLVEFLAGTLTIEALYKAGFLSAAQRDFGGTAVTVIAGLNALSPSLPYLVQGTQAVISGIGTVGSVGAGLAALAAPKV